MKNAENNIRKDLEGLLLAIMAGVAYIVFYRINEFSDTWTVYTQGINLVFLPAGIKHIAILVARGWGALGCLVALFMMASESWSAEPSIKVLGYSMVSIMATWLGITLGLRAMQVKEDLTNLRFTHLPMMDLITTGLHGGLVNLYFIASGMKSDYFLNNAMAMMLGDFIGSFIILMCLLITLKLAGRIKN